MPDQILERKSSHCQAFDELRIDRARTEFCAISGFPLSLASEVVEVARGVFVDGSVIPSDGRYQFLKQLRELIETIRESRSLRSEIRDQERYLSSLRLDLEDADHRRKELKQNLGLPRSWRLPRRVSERLLDD